MTFTCVDASAQGHLIAMGTRDGRWSDLYVLPYYATMSMFLSITQCSELLFRHLAHAQLTTHMRSFFLISVFKLLYYQQVREGTQVHIGQIVSLATEGGRIHYKSVAMPEP